MKKIFLLVPVFSLVMITGCSEKSDNVAAYSGDEIRIKANIGAVTRAVELINTDHTSPLNVKFIRLDGTPQNYQTGSGRNGVIEDGELTLKDANDIDTYPVSGEIGLLGWYPAGTFSATSGTTAKVAFAVDGETDVMFTDLVTGNPIESITFNHVLSHVSVIAYYEDAAAEEAWGDIESITLNDVVGNYEIALPTIGDGTTVGDISPAGGLTPLTFPEPTVDTTTSGEVAAGEALIAPTEELSFTITGEGKVATDVPVSHTFAASTSYVITLKLTLKEEEPVVVEIKNVGAIIGAWGVGSPIDELPVIPDELPVIPDEE